MNRIPPMLRGHMKNKGQTQKQDVTTVPSGPVRNMPEEKPPEAKKPEVKKAETVDVKKT